jgi:tripartite-type tricarboxylate transporter receptor subunit TctC
MALTLLASRSSAQDAYPTHPVRVIAASAAGGNPDVLARILSARLSEIFNNPFVVEDVPGVGGVIAAKQTAAARPDGYTLGLNDSGSLGISIAMNPDANYTLKDFTPITALARLPTILVIRPDVPANTLAEFVALAKSKPGAMSFGSAGTGSIHQMTMIIFAKAAGISLLHVPYRGGTGLVNALLTGEVDAGWSGIPNVVSLIKTGKLRALCISVLERDESLPEVPTCDELGYKGFDVATVLGFAVLRRRARAGCRQAAIRGGKNPARARDCRPAEDAGNPFGRKRHRCLRQIHARRPRPLHQGRRRISFADKTIACWLRLAVAPRTENLRLRKPQPDQPLQRRMIGKKLCRQTAMHDAAALQHDHVLRQR